MGCDCCSLFPFFVLLEAIMIYFYFFWISVLFHAAFLLVGPRSYLQSHWEIVLIINIWQGYLFRSLQLSEAMPYCVL